MAQEVGRVLLLHRHRRESRAVPLDGSSVPAGRADRQEAFGTLIDRQAACIFRCPSRLAANEQALAWADRWRPYAPWPVQQFMIDLTNGLSFYDLPKEQWRRARTHNPLERLIRTLRTRLKPMGGHHDDPTVERAVLGQLIRWKLIPELTHNT